MIKHFSFNIFFLLYIFACSPNSMVQVEEQKIEVKYNRHPSQINLEDSVDVFWTAYPDPFSNPTFTDRFVVTQAKTFKCFLNGKVEVGFLDTKMDSIIYKFGQPSKDKIKLNEHFWIWFAKSSADTSEFPKEFFQSNSENQLNLVLIVNGKKKTILPINLIVPKNMYCFINWSNYFN